MKRIFRFINVYWACFILLLGIFTFFVPPFEKPDEPKHFYRAMSIYFNQWKPVSKYISLPTSIYSFPGSMHVSDILMRPDIKFPISQYKQTYAWRFDKTTIHELTSWPLPAIAYVIYLPGIVASIPFNNLLVTFFLMRLSTALIFFLTVLLCRKILPKRYTVFFLFFIMTPMVLHQVTAISYDAPSLILGMLLFSVFLWLVEKRALTFIHLGILTVLTFLFTVVKGGYYAAYLLPCIALWRYINQKKIRLLKWSIYCAIPLVIISLFVFPSLRQQIFPIGLSYQEQLVFSDPSYFIHVLLFSPAVEQFSWINGMVGTFGWLDYTMPFFFVILYFSAFGIFAFQMISHDKKRLSLIESILVLCIPVVTYILIVYNFLLYETPPGYPIVQSIQGRYFLIIIPFFVYGLSQLYANKPKVLKILGYTGALVVTSGIIIASIYVRYYDFSKTIANGPDLEKRIENKEVVFDARPLQIASASVSIQTVETGKKISGFQLVTAASLIPVDIPYRYTISDGSCMHVFDTGLINPTMVQKSGIVTIYSKIFQAKSDTVCLNIKPAVDHITTSGYWSVETSKLLPIGQFLYVSQ